MRVDDQDKSKKEEKLKEESKQPEPARGDKPKKKGHLLRNCFIIVLIVFILLILAIVSLFFFKVPVISSIVGLNSQKDLGIEATEEAKDSAQQKVPWQFTAEMSEYTLTGNRTFSGKMDLDVELTSEEVTSYLGLMGFPDEVIENVQVKMVEGGMEISSQIKEPVNLPVYFKVDIDKESAKSVSLDIQKAKVGWFSVPQKYIDQAEEFFQDTVNGRLTEVEAVSIETLEYHDGYSVFKGTVPEKVEPAYGKWLDI
ncbi:MAG: hypothetical protein ABIB97_03040 [Patescibacteria group bacterium]